MSTEKKTLEKKKLLVVLDFNGTILDSTHHRRTGPGAPRPDAMARRKFVYYRPGMREFIDWIMAHPDIDVAIWTSNIAENAQALVDTVFRPEQQCQLRFVYSRSQCRTFANYKSQKPMKLMFEQERDRIPSPEQTVVVDDSPEKIANIPTGLCYYQIHTYEAGITPADDSGLATLKEFLEARLADTRPMTLEIY